MPADVTEEDDVDRLHDAAIDRFGRIDILVNNVGVGSYGPLGTMTVEDYDWMMRANMLHRVGGRPEGPAR